MKKFWLIYSHINSGNFTRYESYEAAEDDAKRMAASSDKEFVILEAIASTKRPVPPIDVVKISA
jgi:hypothetical protein